MLCGMIFSECSMTFSDNGKAPSMAVVEHQLLEFERLLSYRCKAENSEVPFMIRSIKKNIDALDLKICDPIIIGMHLNETEFIIPVDKAVNSGKYFSYKALFKLTNAVRQRHYGAYERIDESIAILQKYISDNSLNPDSNPYVLVRNLEREVFDIFISISENIL